MSQEGEIVLTEVQETEWGEKVLLDSPFEAKDFIKVLPWKAYSEEVDEYGSLREKALDREDGELSDSMEAALDAVEAYDGFSDNFSTHVAWDSQQNKWTVDADAFTEARKFWEFVGFDVGVDPNIDKTKL